MHFEEADGRVKSKAPFPLTPALSLGEREKRSPVLGPKEAGSASTVSSIKRLKAGDITERHRSNGKRRLPFPLPQGEG